MTFGGSSWMLLGLLLLLPALVAFLMKRRRVTLRVPSTLLWQGASLKKIRNRRLRNLTRLAALLACLLGIAALALASARPMAAAPSETVAVIVDVSASMQRGSPSPLDQARRTLSRLLLTRSASSRTLILSAGERPRLLAGPTTDGALLEAALDQLRPELGGADLGAAVDLAATLLEGRPSPRLILLHDGGASTGDPPHPLRRGVTLQALRFAPGGQGARADHNLGLVTFASRRPADAEYEDEREVLVAVATSSPVPRTAEITLEAFGAPLARRRLEIPPQGEGELRLRLRTPAQRLTARVSPADDLPDALGADDRAELSQGVVIPPRVVLVAPEGAAEGETFFITEALRAAGVEEILTTSPAEAHQRVSAGDVLVVLGQAPARRPSAPTLFLGTQGGGARGFPVLDQRELLNDGEGGESSPTRLHSLASHHPLLLGVELDGLTVDRALAAEVPDGGRVLVELEGGPVVLSGGDGSEGWVYVGLDPMRSDLVLRVAFPVLISNALALLGGATQQAMAEVVPRAEVSLREAADDALVSSAAAPPSSLRLPSAPALWLSLFGAVLLGAEGLVWRKGWTR